MKKIDPYKKYQRKKKRIEKEALTLWKRLVLEKYPICMACKERESVDPHHYYFKSSYGHLKLDLENGVGLCRTCHSALHFGGDPKKIEYKIKRNMPTIWFRELEHKAFKERPQGSYKTLGWLEEQYNKLKS